MAMGSMSQGCVIDYKKFNVDPNVYLAVIKGEASKVKGKGTGRVLESTADDMVFLYFADHGGTGLVTFPFDDLYADHLLKAFK